MRNKILIKNILLCTFMLADNMWNGLGSRPSSGRIQALNIERQVGTVPLILIYATSQDRVPHRRDFKLN